MKPTKWKQRFKNLSLKRKMLLLYCGSFIFPLILVSIIIYSEVSQSVLEKVEYSAQKGYEQAKSYLEYKILHLIQEMDIVVTSSSLKEQLKETETIMQDPQKQLVQREAIRSYLQSVESSDQGIRIKIYVQDGASFLEDRDYILFLSEADEGLWYQKKGNQKVYFSPGCYLEKRLQKQYVAMIRDIPTEENYHQRCAVLRMDIDAETIRNILCNATPTENAVTYLVDKENIIVISSDDEKIKELGLDGERQEEFSYARYLEDSNMEKLRLNDEIVYCFRGKIRNTDWKMITVIPQKDMISGITHVQYTVAGLMILFGILTISGGAAIISWVVSRISCLNDSFNQVKRGDTKVHLFNDTKDEIGLLYDNYNEMMDYTNELLAERYKLGIRVKSAELKALQSQINPHFLYNTMEMINWLSYDGRTDDIHRAVISLSKYYRLVLGQGKDILTLEEELEHVGYYIEIQDIRFPGQITFTKEIDEDILSCVVPKIILQPLVENAILHGIWEKKEKTGTIRIKGFWEENDVCVQIIDDGIGMDDQLLAEVMAGTVSASGSNYGVKNVHARIQLMFGEGYGLFYTSEKGKGTCVTIRFPDHK